MKKISIIILTLCFLFSLCNLSFACTTDPKNQYDCLFQQMEEEYGINWKFAKAVAAVESGWFSNYKVRKYNNMFGMVGSSGWMKFDSIEDNIMYFGKITSTRSYYKDKSVDEIAKYYVNGKNKHTKESLKWARMVKAIMENE